MSAVDDDGVTRRQISALMIEVYGMDRGLHCVMNKHLLEMLAGGDKVDQVRAALPRLLSLVLGVDHPGGATQGLVAHIYLSLATLLLPPGAAIEQAKLIVCGDGGGGITFNFANSCNHLYMQVWISANSMARSEAPPSTEEMGRFGILLMAVSGLSAPLLLAESVEALCGVLDKFWPIDGERSVVADLRDSIHLILTEQIEREGSISVLSKNASILFSAVRCHCTLARLQHQTPGSSLSRTRRLKELKDFLQQQGFAFLAETVSAYSSFKLYFLLTVLLEFNTERIPAYPYLTVIRLLCPYPTPTLSAFAMIVPCGRPAQTTTATAYFTICRTNTSNYNQNLSHAAS